ncbi:MAG TPA: FKBP-type peptidyl-prolyl cis-trans isomerase [Armatimonadota bacterium]|nr:FKBP-type peptidyl-prolyl cis-trans isomerase [Armatimonadota bacterium]
MSLVWLIRCSFIGALVVTVLAPGCGKPKGEQASPPVRRTATPAPAGTGPGSGLADKAKAVEQARKLGTGTEQPLVTTSSGLQYIEVVEGSGKQVQKGSVVDVDYTGWLVTGFVFDSSLQRRESFSFKVGAGNVIKGWDEGLVGMKAGGIRKLIIPAELGYGDRGTPSIPPGATLIFEVIARRVL